MLKLPPLSLYIHYPWCVKKCPYCDFNSHQQDNTQDYIKALLKDLNNDLNYVQGRTIYSIFIGGGTPSLMSENELSELFNGLKKCLNFDDNIEITLEANPSSFEIEKFKVFKKIGVNRLSIGVQSFNNQYLKSLGRIHNADDAGKACTKASDIFDNVNIDLMYGLENQTLKECLFDIQQAMDFNPTHISFYQLTIEPNTLFAKFPPSLPKEDTIWHMGEMGVELLEQNGFNRYEVSAFGKKPSKHNLNYWQFGDYIGIGAGAHGKITNLDNQQIIRTTKPKLPKDYLKNQTRKVKAIENIAFDFMLNALRLKQGFDGSLFASRSGESISQIRDKLIHAESLGLLVCKNSLIRPTNKGFDFLNDLQELFL